MATVLSLVEPVLLVVMAVVVAGMLLAFYLPMFEAISAIQRRIGTDGQRSAAARADGPTGALASSAPRRRRRGPWPRATASSTWTSPPSPPTPRS